MQKLSAIIKPYNLDGGEPALSKDHWLAILYIIIIII